MTMEKADAVRRGGVPLLTVDDVVAAVLDRSGVHHHGIGPGHLHLGHGEATPDLAFDQGPQVLLLLLRRAVEMEDLYVAGIRGMAPEDEMTQRGSAE